MSCATWMADRRWSGAVFPVAQTHGLSTMLLHKTARTSASKALAQTAESAAVASNLRNNSIVPATLLNHLKYEMPSIWTVTSQHMPSKYFYSQLRRLQFRLPSRFVMRSFCSSEGQFSFCTPARNIINVLSCGAMRASPKLWLLCSACWHAQWSVAAKVMERTSIGPEPPLHS